MANFLLYDFLFFLVMWSSPTFASSVEATRIHDKHALQAADGLTSSPKHNAVDFESQAAPAQPAVAAPTPPQPTTAVVPPESPNSVGGMEYLGVGYNLILGNPYGGAQGDLDPGFTEPIIEHQFGKTYKSYLGMGMDCPAGIHVRREFQCNHASKATEISSSSEMAAALDTQASSESEVSAEFEGGGMGVGVSASASARFSGSEGFKASASEMEDSSSEFFDATTLCTEFFVGYERYFKPVLHSVFLDALEALPDFNDCNATKLEKNCGEDYLQYMDFIRTYGTDYITSVNMGAKKIHRLIIKSSEVTRLKSEGRDVAKEAAIEASVSAEGWGQAGSVSGSHSESFSVKGESSSGSSLSKSETSTVDINVGGYPSGDWMEWAQSVSDRPMPIKYTMDSIPSLLLKVDRDKHGTKATALRNAINSYSLRRGVAGSNAASQGLMLLLGMGGSPKQLGFALARVDGSQVAQNTETMLVQTPSPGIKTFTFSKEFDEEPVALANVVVGSLGGFTKGDGTQSDCASIVSASAEGITTKTGPCKITDNAAFTWYGELYAPRTYKESLAPIDHVTSLIAGVNVKNSGVMFGKVNKDGTTMGSTSADFHAATVEGHRMPVIAVSMDQQGYRFDQSGEAPPAVVAVGIDAGSSVGMSQVCGVVFDKSSKTWSAFLVPGFASPASNDADDQYDYQDLNGLEGVPNDLNFMVAGAGCKGDTTCNDDVMNEGVPGLTWANWGNQEEAVQTPQEASFKEVKQEEAGWGFVSNRGISNTATQDLGYIEFIFDTPYQKPPSCVVSQVHKSSNSGSYLLDAGISSDNECEFQLGVNAVIRGLSTTKVGLETGQLSKPVGTGAVAKSFRRAVSVVCIGVPVATAAGCEGHPTLRKNCDKSATATAVPAAPSLVESLETNVRRGSVEVPPAIGSWLHSIGVTTPADVEAVAKRCQEWEAETPEDIKMALDESTLKQLKADVPVVPFKKITRALDAVE